MSDLVVVKRELLELLQERLDPHRDAAAWGALCDALRRAQPAEAEGAPVPVAGYLVDVPGEPELGQWYEEQAEDGDDPLTRCRPLVRQSDHLAALSAVTAERDKIDADRRACWVEFKALVKSSGENERYLQGEIDRLRAALAAKEA